MQNSCFPLPLLMECSLLIVDTAAKCHQYKSNFAQLGRAREEGKMHLLMRIGNHLLKNRLIVAPMAGVTDRPFRQLCKKLGAAWRCPKW